jgi:hypothetical protein
MSVVSRVTRLGEFSPDGQLFTLAFLIKYYKSSFFLGYILSTATNGWAKFWAIFFTNSSDRPGGGHTKR